MRAKLCSGELVVRGDQWPLLVYTNQEFDPEDPWNGLFRSRLLVWVAQSFPLSSLFMSLIPPHTDVQTYFYLAQLCGEGSEIHEIWKCSDPRDDSSHDSLLGVCRNAGMFCRRSIHLWLTVWQLRFALCSSSVFCRTDTSTNSERFYESVLAFLDHPDEEAEVRDLLYWWNWWVPCFILDPFDLMF